MIKYKNKTITIDNFHIKSYVPWGEVETVLGKRNYNKFMKWMFGQTSYLEGVYVHDLKRWLEIENTGKKNSYFD